MKSTQVVGIIAALVVVAVVAYLLGTMSQTPPTPTTTVNIYKTEVSQHT